MFFLFLPSLRRVGRVFNAVVLKTIVQQCTGNESSLPLLKLNLVNRGFFAKIFGYFYYYQFKKNNIYS